MRRRTVRDREPTEKSGGTEASFPVLFSSVEIGKIRSAFGAGGCLADEAKNVALTVAKDLSETLRCREFV